MISLKRCRAAMTKALLGTCILLCFQIAWSSAALAEGDNPLSPVNRSSPSETYQSLVSGAKRLEDLYRVYTVDKSFANLHEIRYQFNRLRTLLDLDAVPSANRVKIGNAALTYLSDILVRLPALDPTSIPGAIIGESPLPARWTIPGTDIQIARVDSGPHAGEYLFTAESIANLAEYYRRVRDLPVLQPRYYPWFHKEHINATGPLIPDWLTRDIPESWKVLYLNTPVWKIVAIAFVLVVVLTLAYVWARVVRTQSRHGSEVRKLWWRFTLPAVLLTIYYVSEWFVIAHINPAGLFATGESLLSTAVLYGAAAWATWIGCFLVAEVIINTPRIAGNSLDTHLLRLAARVTAIGATGGILIYGANEIGIPAFGLIAGIGIGGFALALAAQSTIENLIGGVALFADRPFRIGDVISFGNERGSVEMVGTRSSRIRALDGTLVTVPNSDLAKMKIVNFTKRNKCLFHHTLALHVDTPANQLRLLLHRVRSLMTEEDMVEKTDSSPRVRCVGVAVGRIEVELRASVLTMDYTKFLAVQEALLLRIFELIEEMDIEFAPPALASIPNVK